MWKQPACSPHGQIRAGGVWHVPWYCLRVGKKLTGKFFFWFFSWIGYHGWIQHLKISGAAYSDSREKPIFAIVLIYGKGSFCSRDEVRARRFISHWDPCGLHLLLAGARGIFSRAVVAISRELIIFYYLLDEKLQVLESSKDLVISFNGWELMRPYWIRRPHLVSTCWKYGSWKAFGHSRKLSRRKDCWWWRECSPSSSIHLNDIWDSSSVFTSTHYYCIISDGIFDPYDRGGAGWLLHQYFTSQHFWRGICYAFIRSRVGPV